MNAEQIDTKAARDAYIAGLGIEYTALFVPQKLSRSSGEKNPSLNWRVTIARDKGRGYSRAVISTDYTQGIGHLPHYKPRPRSATIAEAEYHDAQDKAAESGQSPSVPWAKWRAGSVWVMQLKPVPPPPLADILYSFIMDANGTEESFEDWCASLGFDSDSRNAEAVYRACCDKARQLRRMFTAAERAELETLFQDY